MRICKRSANSLAFLLTTPFATAGTHAQRVADAPVSSPPGAAEAVATEGREAMERLRGAMAAPRQAMVGPMTPILPGIRTDEQTRRRTFAAMRHQESNPAMGARAATASALGEAGLASQTKAMAQRVGQALGLQAPDIAELAKVPVPWVSVGWVPLLFVSSSMPIETLRTYARQLERTGGAFAFRGMPGGLHAVAPMAKLSAGILRLDPGCEGPACAMRPVQIVVDPIAFRQHGIAQVPALAMVPGDPTQPYCERGEAAPSPGPVVYGDAALTGLLEEYARLGGKEEVRDAQARLGNR
jgi:type-F conjugative transfer system pilin assembly protein TrbC